LEAEQLQQEQAVANQKARVDAINVQRQQHQQQAGQTLHKLNGKWHELTQKKFHLEMATSKLEQEVEELRAKQSATTDQTEM
jgi:hypothetical protein